MRTTIYIDGFNFYYRGVRGTPYKWLDVKSESSNGDRPRFPMSLRNESLAIKLSPIASLHS